MFIISTYTISYAVSPFYYTASINRNKQTAYAITATDLDLRAYVKGTLYYTGKDGEYYEQRISDKSAIDSISISFSAPSANYISKLESYHNGSDYDWHKLVTT